LPAPCRHWAGHDWLAETPSSDPDGMAEIRDHLFEQELFHSCLKGGRWLSECCVRPEACPPPTSHIRNKGLVADGTSLPRLPNRGGSKRCPSRSSSSARQRYVGNHPSRRGAARTGLPHP